MIEPALSDEALLSDVARAPEDPGVFHLWWLGQSGFLVKWRRHHLLIDPYLSDSLAKKYAGTDKPHIRMTRRPIAPERLDFIDLAASSHHHTDHLDAETLIPLLEKNPGLILVIPEAIRPLAAERLKIAPERPLGLNDGTAVTAGPFQVNGVAAAHEQIERDASGNSKCLGYVIRFGSWAVYHSGDTVRFDGMAEHLRRWPIDLALLPVNGRAPERRVPGNLSGREAARLAKDLGARLAIPCHYEMFAFNTASPEEFSAECRRLGQPFQVLRCGERWSSTALKA